MKRTLASLASLATLAAPLVVGIVAGYASASASAGDNAAAAKSTYQKERADCDAPGRSAEDRASCLKEAGAAQLERKRNTLDSAGPTRENAIDRCNLVALKDKADCLARIEGPAQPNQRTKTSGSVTGGGVIRESTTTTTGPPTVIIVPGAAPAASAPN